MLVRDLIARLSALDPELPVLVRRPTSCCCGEYFLPLDDFDDDPSPTAERPYGHGQDGTREAVVL